MGEGRIIMTKPITPSEIAKAKESFIPSEVIEAVNELIAINYTCGYALVYQKAIVELASKKLKTDQFNYQWLNIEEIYREAGWKVNYDKPEYNESYPAFFEFKK